MDRDFHLRLKELLGRVSSFLLTIKKAIKLRKTEGKGGLGDVVRKIHYFKNSPRVKSSNTKACRQLCLLYQYCELHLEVISRIAS